MVRHAAEIFRPGHTIHTMATQNSLPKRIGVLTGGGDCPGLNAVIRAVTKDAIYHGIEVIGIRDGFEGLIKDNLTPLGVDDVSNILTVGGTILGSSNRANPQRYATGTNPDGSPRIEDVTDRCMATSERHGLEALVVIGGDGTMTCADPFTRLGLRVIGVPKTIDNDIHGTDVTFGFATAVDIATEALDRIHTTAASHHRAMVVEVMGRNAGWIALHAGLASGSDVICIPEIPFRIDKVCEAIRARGKRGKRFSIVCVAEGAAPADGQRFVERTDPTSPDPIRLGGVARWLAAQIEDCTGIESRYTVLGHVQRGGTPSAADRVLATQFGHHAMELLKRGADARMVAVQHGRLADAPLTEAAGRQRTVPQDHPLIHAARSVYTSFGD